MVNRRVTVETGELQGLIMEVKCGCIRLTGTVLETIYRKTLYSGKTTTLFNFYDSVCSVSIRNVTTVFNRLLSSTVTPFPW